MMVYLGKETKLVDELEVAPQSRIRCGSQPSPFGVIIDPLGIQEASNPLVRADVPGPSHKALIEVRLHLSKMRVVLQGAQEPLCPFLLHELLIIRTEALSRIEQSSPLLSNIAGRDISQGESRVQL